MALDLVIRNGLLVDGTGAPARRADIGVLNGKIFSVQEQIQEKAARVIDASGLAVAPGFIDPHTHYDAQICWDGALTPSSWHGVTSVVMGNCGVGIAPCRPETREFAMRDLVNVEAIPFEVLNQGITWDWESFPQFMDAAAARKPALNLAFLAPLTPFRHYVMGEASMERAASVVELNEIKKLLGEAIDAGAFGFSSTLLNQHMGYAGRPLACRNASREELRAYCNALRERGKGAIEIAMTKQIGVMEEPELELLDFMLTESARPITFIAMFDRDDISEAVRTSLRKAAPMIARGARPQTSPLPLTREINMRNPFSFIRGIEEMGGSNGRGSRRRPGQGRRRRVSRPDAGRRPRQRVHHDFVQQPRRPDGGDPEQPGHAAGPRRRRRAPRHVVRLGLSELHAGHLGAGKEGAHAGSGWLCAGRESSTQSSTAR